MSEVDEHARRHARTEGALRREVGLLAGTLVGVNAMIGTGIFKKSAPIARDVGSVEGMLFVWVLGGVIALAGALSLAELAAALPRTGGLYEYVRRAFGERAALLLGFDVVEAEDMPSIGANSLAIAFGDFKAGYQIVDRQGIRILRDSFTAKPYVKFYTTKRVGGGIVNF